MNLTELIQERQIRIESARLGAIEALKAAGLYTDEISQNQAFHEYGRIRIETLTRIGMIDRLKVGTGRNCKVTYQRSQITEALAILKRNNVPVKSNLLVK